MRVFGTQYFTVNLDFVKLPVDLKAFIYNQANLQHFNFDSEESKPGYTKLSLDFPGMYCFTFVVYEERRHNKGNEKLAGRTQKVSSVWEAKFYFWIDICTPDQFKRGGLENNLNDNNIPYVPVFFASGNSV